MIIILTIIIFVSLIAYLWYKETIYYKNLRSKVIIGSKWYITKSPRYYKDIDPFQTYDIYYLTVIDIAKNKYGVKFVKYEFDDKSTDSMELEQFICSYSPVNEINS